MGTYTSPGRARLMGAIGPAGAAGPVRTARVRAPWGAREPAVTGLGRGCQEKKITLTFRRILKARSEKEFTFLSSPREIRFLLMLRSRVS